MSKAPNPKHGYMPCPDCTARVLVRKNADTETLSYRCDECDGSGYCKKGEGRYAMWAKKIERIAPDPAPAPAPKPPKEKDAPPAAAGKKGTGLSWLDS